MSNPTTRTECVEIMQNMYADARRLACSDDPYFTVRGRAILAELHNMVKSQAPETLPPHIIDIT